MRAAKRIFMSTLLAIGCSLPWGSSWPCHAVIVEWGGDMLARFGINFGPFTLTGFVIEGLASGQMVSVSLNRLCLASRFASALDL